MAHLYASFADASLAEKAAGALLDFGVRQEDITLVAHDEYGKTRASYAAGTAGVSVYDTPTVHGDLNPLDQGGPDSMAHGDTVEKSRTLADEQVKPHYGFYDPNLHRLVEHKAISRVIGDPNMTLHHQVYTGKTDTFNHNEDTIGEPGYPKCLTTPN